MNKVFLIGNLGGDVKLAQTGGGKPTANFSLAVQVGWGDSQHTEWYRCGYVGKRAQGGLNQYLLKGQQVAVLGDQSHREYTNGSGELKTSNDVYIQDIQLLGGKPGAASGNQVPDNQPNGNQASPPDDFDDDVPF